MSVSGFISILKPYFEIVGAIVNNFLSVKGLCSYCREKTITRLSVVEVSSRIFKLLDLSVREHLFLVKVREGVEISLFKCNLCQTKNQLKILHECCFLMSFIKASQEKWMKMYVLGFINLWQL